MKVAIAGGAVQSRHWQQYGKGWEVWGLNAIRPPYIMRFHRMFNLHRFAHLERDCPQYIDVDSVWSRRHPDIPFYVVDSWRGLLKNQILFPLAALRALPRGGVYHASSLDMMVALALYEKRVTEIAIHGVSFHIMESGEPISARACLEYWLGMAEGRGVKVTISKDCDALFQQYHYVRSNSIYGFDDVRMIEDRTK